MSKQIGRTMDISGLRHNRVKVETPEGTVEGLLKYIEGVSSHKKGNYYREGCVILENGNSLFIVKKWICVKKA